MKDDYHLDVYPQGKGCQFQATEKAHGGVSYPAGFQVVKRDMYPNLIPAVRNGSVSIKTKLRFRFGSENKTVVPLTI